MDSKHHDHELKAADRPMRRGHIGLIVAGSLMTGFVVSIVLVIGPFGGGQEHVIMGTALLGWALGWGLLAVLSMRWTDQPQQWAVVPAALMALTGASLLIFRPDANAFNLLGWIWPPALIALAVWTTVRAKAGATHQRVRRTVSRLQPTCTPCWITRISRPPIFWSVTRQGAPTRGSSPHATRIRSPAWSCSTRSQTKPSPDFRTSPPSTTSSVQRQPSFHPWRVWAYFG